MVPLGHVRRVQCTALRAKGPKLQLLSTEALLDETHELLLPLVGHLHVLEELSKLERAVGGEHERLAGLGEELDEVPVVAGRDVREPRVRGGDVRGDGRVQQSPEWWPVDCEWFGDAPADTIIA